MRALFEINARILEMHGEVRVIRLLLEDDDEEEEEDAGNDDHS